MGGITLVSIASGMQIMWLECGWSAEMILSNISAPPAGFTAIGGGPTGSKSSLQQVGGTSISSYTGVELQGTRFHATGACHYYTLTKIKSTNHLTRISSKSHP